MLIRLATKGQLSLRTYMYTKCKCMRGGGGDRGMVGREGVGLTVSSPLQSILSWTSGRVYRSPAYLFLLIRR